MNTTSTPHRRRGFFASLVLLLMAACGLTASAQLSVSMMPSYSQSLTYANAAINESIQVWGRVSGGSGTYAGYTIDFGDGTPVASGTVNNTFNTFQIGGRDFLQSPHTYTSGGSKTVTLTVTDSLGATATGTATIRVLVAPTHDQRVNMAIEKGLIYLYRNQTRTGSPLRSFWYQNAAEYGNGATGAALMSFAENGHLATNDPVTDVYADTVRRGVYQVISIGRNQAITAQSGGNPDTNGNARGINFTPNFHVYDGSFLAMGVINAYPNAAAALAATIPAGIWVGGGVAPASVHQFVTDVLDCYYWCQTDNTANRNGWYYNTNSANTGTVDGSTHQWPCIAMLTAKDRWGVTPPAWVVTNSNNALVGLQYALTGNALDGSVGYSSNTQWRNSGKTGGALVGWYLGGKLVGPDSNANRALAFIARNWYSTTTTGSGADNGGWDGELYAMFGMKKGLQLMGVTTVTTPDTAVHDWYQEFSAWLLGNASLLHPSVGPGARRTLARSFGQNADGSWSNNEWPIGAINVAPLTTAHAVLILTQSVTIPLPVAVIAPIPDQSSRFPAAFTLDGSGSYHQDTNSSIVEYLWDLDASNGLNWITPDATGRITSANPGWSTPGNRTVTLRIKDDNLTPNYATETRVVRVVDTDVAPVSVPIPTNRVPAIYTGQVGATILLDGTDSFDPEGDPITAWAWDLDGNGTFGTAADIARDTSGNNAAASTASLIFAAPYAGQVSLRVTSTPPAGLPKNSTNNPPVDVQVTNSDLFISSLTSSNVVIGTSADLQVVIQSVAGSTAANSVVLRFYNGNPLTVGTVIGSSVTVTIPAGATVPVNVTGLPLSPGQEYVWAYIDATSLFAEYNETNNTASVNVSNKPPVAVAQNVEVVADDVNCQGIVTAAMVNNGSSDPDGDPLTFTLTPAGPFALGSTPVTLSVSDGRITVTATATVTVVDRTPPVLAGQGASVTIECPEVPSFTAPTADDCCDPGATVMTVSDVSTPGACPGSYSRTITWKARDAAGNESAPVSQTITVADTTGPTINGQGGNATIECPAVPEFTAPVAADTCDPNPTVTEVSDVTIPGTCPGSYTRTKTWRATDCAGNQSAAVTQTITVADTTAPAINGQGADATIECPAVPQFTAPTSLDACDPAPVVSEVGDVTVPGNCPGVYVRTKSWKATDCGGNQSAVVSQTISVVDTTPPTLAGQGADVTIECPAVPVFTAPTAQDTCDADPVVTELSDVTVPGVCPGVYVRTKTWKATDCSGNSSGTVSQTITSVDTTAPVLAGQGANATIECPAVPVFTAPTAQDTCDADPVVTELSDVTVPGACPGIYTRTKTWQASDCSGNLSDPVSQTIIVTDTGAPTLAGQGANATLECPAVPQFTAPTAQDTCDDDPVVTEVGDVTVPGTCPGSYTRTKTWRATDCAGNLSAAVTQTITVADTTPPVLSGEGADATIECPEAPVFTPPAGADLCDPNVIVREVADVTIPGSCPGSYTRTKTWRATDCAGNEATAVDQTITVVDTTAPVISGQGADATIECPAAPVFTAPVALDACDANPVVSVVSDVTTPGVCAGVYRRTVTWKATDCTGNNSTTLSQTITVVDTTRPLITCPPDVCIVSDAASCSATGVNIGLATATDTCCVPHVAKDRASTTYPVGQTLVTWTATDDSGNSAFCVQKVTVLSSVGITFRPPLAGQPVGNKLRRGQVIPHKVELRNCSGLNVTAGVTVKLRVLGIDSATGNIFQDVIEDAQGTGTDGTAGSDGLMVLTGIQWHFNLDTSNFTDNLTINGTRFYLSTVTVIDNATLKVLGSGSVNLETAK